jgi:hypothetical protein
MRVKEFVHKIKSSVYYGIYADVNNCERDVFEARLLHKYIDEGPWRGKNMRYNYIKNMQWRFIPSYNKTLTFQYGEWGNVRVSFTIRHGDEKRLEAGVKARMSVYFCDLRQTPQVIWDNGINAELPMNLNLDDKSLEKHAKKVLSKLLYEEGFIARLQRYYNRDKKFVRKTYVAYNNGMKARMEASMDEDKFRKWVLKNFNIESYVSMEDTIQIVNQIGKQENTRRVERMDMSWFNDFDGDIDELEEEYFGRLDSGVLYI